MSPHAVRGTGTRHTDGTVERGREGVGEELPGHRAATLSQDGTLNGTPPGMLRYKLQAHGV